MRSLITATIIVALLAGSAVVVAAQTDETALPSSGCDVPLAAPGDYPDTYAIGDMTGKYWTVVPETYADDAPLPLVLWLSSGRGDADQQYPGLRPYLEGIDELFVVVGKLSSGGGWDTDALLALIDRIEADYCVDTRRIHVMGSSSSAFPTSQLACEASERIASFRVAMGGFPLSGCEPERSIPLIAITGDADRSGVFSSTKEWAEAYGCEAEPLVEELGAGVSRRSYRGCEADVEVLDIEGVPHVFVFHECVGPAASSGLCRENEVADELQDSLAFFEEHPLPAQDLPPYAAITGTLSARSEDHRADIVTRETPPEVVGSDWAWTNSMETNDPRLTVTCQTNLNYEQFVSGSTGGALRSGIGRCWNDGGSWAQEIHGFAKPGESTMTGNHYVTYLTGEGAYEGLFAMLLMIPGTSVWNVDGVIAPGPMPDPPASVVPSSATTDEDPLVPSLATVGEPADSGARIIEVEALDERTVDLTIDSPAVGSEKVRLLLPAGFDPEGDGAWPVLYLLHGAFDDYTSWTRETDVAELTADLPVLVAMPEAGGDGWYADWWNGGEGGPPMWEEFHLTEVRELLERNWQAGDERVVAGLSMGGLGAMTYAARHPEFFKAAAAFSGVLHPVTLPFDLHPGLWGDRTEQADVWGAHDPVLLADALSGIPLYVAYGTGEPGPLDAADAPIDDTEAWIAEMNDAFVARLDELGIPAVVDAYGAGTHTWPYFERSLHEAMPMLLEALEG